eukprot:m.16300 g.16300  ORF g.16300 m.16300 type:complete len:728 (+) comp26841_c0_seq1:70-2253(+)
MAAQYAQQIHPAEKKGLSHPLQLDDCVVGEVDTAHSLHAVLRHKALWMNSPVAVTQLPLENNSELQKMVNSLQSLRHPNILQFLGVVSIPNEPLLHVVTEPLNDNLSGLLKRLPQLSFQIRVAGLLQIARGLCYLHLKSITHGNLDAESVFAASDGLVMKIGYFGQSRDKDATKETSQDVKSFGILMETMFGHPETEAQFLANIKACEGQEDEDETAKKIVSITKRCEKKDLSERLSTKDVVDLLSIVMEGIPQPEAKESLITKNKAEEEIIQLKSDLKSKTDTIISLKAKLSQSKESQGVIELTTAKKGLQEKEKELEAIRQTKSKAEEEIKQLRSDLESKTKNFTKLEAKVKQRKATQDEEEEKLREAIKERDRQITQKKQELTETRTAIEQTNRDHATAVEKLRTEISSKESKIKNLKLSNVEESSKVSEKSKEIDELEHTIAATLKVLEERNSQLNTVDDYLEKYDRRKANLRADLGSEFQSSQQSKQTAGTIQEVKSPDSAMKAWLAGLHRDKKDPVFVCTTCSTPIQCKMDVCYLRIPQTTAVRILSDYSATATRVKQIIEAILKQQQKEITVTTVTRRQFKDAKEAMNRSEDTCIIAVPILERYIINDPDDPSTGFTREIESLKRENVIVIAFYHEDAQVNQNYHPKMNQLWAEGANQKALKPFAEHGRFYTLKKDLKPWQVSSLAGALGILPKGIPASSLVEEQRTVVAPYLKKLTGYP